MHIGSHRRIALGLLLSFALGQAAQAQSPWPALDADPSLVEQIRTVPDPASPLGPYDLTIIPRADNPAERAAWLSERYDMWLQLAAAAVLRWRQPAIPATSGRARSQALASVIPLAEQAKAAVLEAERVRLAVLTGRSPAAALDAATAARDAAERAFRDADRDRGLSAGAPLALNVNVAALQRAQSLAEYTNDVARQKAGIEARLAAAAPRIEPRDLADAQRLTRDALAAQDRRLAAEQAHHDAQAAAERSRLDPAILDRENAETMAYRLVRDSVQRGRLPPSALEEAAARLKAAQEASWDQLESGWGVRSAETMARDAARLARRAASDAQWAQQRWLTEAEQRAYAASPAGQEAEARRIAAAEARVAELTADYERMVAGGALGPEVLAGFYRRVEDARAAVNAPPRQAVTAQPGAPLTQLGQTLDRPPLVLAPRPQRPAALPVLPPPGLGVTPPRLPGQALTLPLASAN